MEQFRIQEDTPIYYLTFSVVHWLPVFVSETSCLIITDSLNFCHREKGLVRDGTHWRFSSAAYWLLASPGETDVVLTEVAW